MHPIDGVGNAVTFILTKRPADKNVKGQQNYHFYVCDGQRSVGTCCSSAIAAGYSAKDKTIVLRYYDNDWKKMAYWRLVYNGSSHTCSGTPKCENCAQYEALLVYPPGQPDEVPPEEPACKTNEDCDSGICAHETGTCHTLTEAQEVGSACYNAQECLSHVCNAEVENSQSVSGFCEPGNRGKNMPCSIDEECQAGLVCSQDSKNCQSKEKEEQPGFWSSYGWTILAAAAILIGIVVAVILYRRRQAGKGKQLNEDE